MQNKKPKRTVKELLLEAKLTKRKFLIVEGASDRRFFVQWFQQSKMASALDAICISDVEVDIEGMLQVGLQAGNRSMVIFLARSLGDNVTDVRCLADLDCGFGVGEFDAPSLLWTDFPALESYAFDPDVLNVLSNSFLSERLPEGEVLVRTFSDALAALFTVRLNNPHMPTPNIDKGFQKSGRGAAMFDVKKAVSPSIASKVDSYTSAEYVDIREVVYGHDLAAVFMSAYGNIIKNQCGLKDPDALENALRASILIDGSFADLPLFKYIQDWSSN